MQPPAGLRIPVDLRDTVLYLTSDKEKLECLEGASKQQSFQQKTRISDADAILHSFQKDVYRIQAFRIVLGSLLELTWIHTGSWLELIACCGNDASRLLLLKQALPTANSLGGVSCFFLHMLLVLFKDERVKVEAAAEYMKECKGENMTCSNISDLIVVGMRDTLFSMELLVLLRSHIIDPANWRIFEHIFQSITYRDKLASLFRGIEPNPTGATSSSSTSSSSPNNNNNSNRDVSFVRKVSVKEIEGFKQAVSVDLQHYQEEYNKTKPAWQSAQRELDIHRIMRDSDTKFKREPLGVLGLKRQNANDVAEGLGFHFNPPTCEHESPPSAAAPIVSESSSSSSSSSFIQWQEPRFKSCLLRTKDLLYCGMCNFWIRFPSEHNHWVHSKPAWEATAVTHLNSERHAYKLKTILLQNNPVLLRKLTTLRSNVDLFADTTELATSSWRRFYEEDGIKMGKEETVADHVRNAQKDMYLGKMILAANVADACDAYVVPIKEEAIDYEAYANAQPVPVYSSSPSRSFRKEQEELEEAILQSVIAQSLEMPETGSMPSLEEPATDSSKKHHTSPITIHPPITVEQMQELHAQDVKRNEGKNPFEILQITREGLIEAFDDWSEGDEENEEDDYEETDF